MRWDWVGEALTTVAFPSHKSTDSSSVLPHPKGPVVGPVQKPSPASGCSVQIILLEGLSPWLKLKLQGWWIYYIKVYQRGLSYI